LAQTFQHALFLVGTPQDWGQAVSSYVTKEIREPKAVTTKGTEPRCFNTTTNFLSTVYIKINIGKILNDEGGGDRYNGGHEQNLKMTHVQIEPTATRMILAKTKEYTTLLQEY
jgi:hypothetical protein